MAALRHLPKSIMAATIIIAKIANITATGMKPFNLQLFFAIKLNSDFLKLACFSLFRVPLSINCH